MESFKKSGHFIEDIIDGMYDWVRVLDKEDNVLFMNRAMAESVENPSGKKCYELLGKKEPCKDCISRISVFDGTPHEKDEYIGDRIFSVMSSPVRNQEGEVIAVVEVLRETTNVARLQQEIMRQHRKLNDELNIARKLQKRLLPREFRHERLEFSYIYKPCEALGGDFLDIFEIDPDHVGIYIADVSGHGIPASMLTIFLKSSLDKKLLSPAAALRDLYTEFNNGVLDEDMYITVFYAVIDTKAGTMTYSNAGHSVSPMVIRGEKLELLRLPGVPISNWVASPEYSEGRIGLEPGDTLFLSTDGIIEMKGESGDQFGADRLLDCLMSAGRLSETDLEDIVKKACDFSGLRDVTGIPDDITMALVRIF